MKLKLAVATAALVFCVPAAFAAVSAVPVGTWYGINGTVGTLVLRSNHTYVYNARSRGTWSAIRGGVAFHGPLAVWNRGRATIKNGVMEFYWRTASGATQYFVFERG